MSSRKRLMVFVTTLMLMAFVFVEALPTFALQGEVPYNSYTYWESDSFTAISAKASYEPQTVLTAARLGIDSFAEINDVCTDKAGNIYVLDGKSSRIVILNPDYTVKRIITEVITETEKLKFEKAKGIFVDTKGKIYIADTEHARVIVCSENGEYVDVITLPDSKLIPDGFNYRPIKIAVDSNDYVYVLSDGSYHGAILYSPKGEFFGFYGANSVEGSVMTVIQNLWEKLTSNNEKRAGQSSSLPYQFTDLFVDEADFIYTATGKIPGNSQKAQIKRLSPGGKNILDSSEVVFGDKTAELVNGETRIQNVAGLSVDSNGYIYCYDATSGKVFVYDSECYMVTAFGGSGVGTQNGTFKQISAIDILEDGKKIIVADGLKLTLTVFSETEYGAEIKAARKLTIDGDYAASESLWKEIYSKDQNCQLAYIGLAKVELSKKNYEAAADYAKAGLDKELYSKAFDYNRKAFLKENFDSIMVIILLAVAAVTAFAVYAKKKKLVFVKNEKLKLMLSAPMHPALVFGEVKTKGMGSVILGTVIIALYYATSVLKETASGFLFRSTDYTSFNSVLVLLQTAGFIVLWTVANWAVATLNGGIGKFKEIYIVICYSIIPMLISNVVYIICSYALNASEGEFLTVFILVMQLYSIFMVIIGSIIIHDISFGKFLFITLLTLIGVVIIVFLLVLIFVFFQQAAAFAATIWREIFFR